METREENTQFNTFFTQSDFQKGPPIGKMPLAQY